MEVRSITVTLVQNSTNVYDVQNAVWAEQQLGSDVNIIDAFRKALPYQPYDNTVRDYVITGSSQNLAKLMTRLFP